MTRNYRAIGLVAAVLVVLIVLVTVSGCDRQASGQAVCVNPTTHVRVNDNQCNTNGGDSSFLWWYLLANQSAPRVGAVPRYGSSVSPGGSVIRGGVSTGGGAVKPPKVSLLKGIGSKLSSGSKSGGFHSSGGKK